MAVKDSGQVKVNFINPFDTEENMDHPDNKKKPHDIQARFQPKIIRILSGLSIVILFFSVIILPITTEATDHAKIINCDVHHGTCTQNLRDTDVILDINPKPVKAMKDLNFTITLTGKQPVSAPYIDLGMPGMKMGPNRVALKSIGKGVYTGSGIIVRCPSGKRIWEAAVTVPDIGSVEFIFDVIY